jgi:hypothetical protein
MLPTIWATASAEQRQNYVAQQKRGKIQTYGPRADLPLAHCAIRVFSKLKNQPPVVPADMFTRPGEPKGCGTVGVKPTNKLPTLFDVFDQQGDNGTALPVAVTDAWVFAKHSVFRSRC